MQRKNFLFVKIKGIGRKSVFINEKFRKKEKGKASRQALVPFDVLFIYYETNETKGKKLGH